METITQNNRLVIVDALRGFALAGVAIVHMGEQYIAGPTPEGFMEGVNSLPDQIISGTIAFLIIGKFFALFSILFGLSFGIQMESAAKRGVDFSLRFLWRAVLLFLIGSVHQLFYRGDILTIYALLVPFLIPFYKVNNKWLLGIAAIFFLSIPRFISFGIFGNESLFGIHQMIDNTAPMIGEYLRILQTGSFSELAQTNAIYGMKSKMDFQLSFFGRFYYTFGYFLLGLWMTKIGLFRNLETYLPNVKKALKWSFGFLVLAIILTASTFMTAPQPIDFSKAHQVLGINFMDMVSLAFTMIILCSFILLYQKAEWEKRLSFFAPYGRMALTNYILQSVIGTFILFGWGLGYIGQIRTLYLFLISILLITFQTLFSKFWLSKFKYGPLEWLWRSGTYLKIQKFKK